MAYRPGDHVIFNPLIGYEECYEQIPPERFSVGRIVFVYNEPKLAELGLDMASVQFNDSDVSIPIYCHDLYILKIQNITDYED